MSSLSEKQQQQQEAKTTFSKVENVALMVFLIVAFPQQILFRKSFGERHLRFFHASFLSVTIYLLWVGVLISSPWLLSQKETIFTWFFCLTIAVMSTIHAIEITFRKKTTLIHSRYTGESRILRPLAQILPDWVKLKLSDWDIDLEIFIKMYIEPMLGLLVGSFVASIDPLLGSILMVSAIGNYVIGQYRAAIDRDKYLDIIDGMIEGQEMQNMLSGKSGSDTRGFESYSRSKVLVPTTQKPEKTELADTTALSPELQGLLDEEEETTHPQTESTHTVKVGNSPVGNERISRPKGRPRKDTSAVYP
jgi:hypothetical protein